MTQAQLLEALHQYRAARHKFLNALGVVSNRDPLSEFAETFVAGYFGGTKANSRIEAGWDVMVNGERVQVRYASYPKGRLDDNPPHFDFRGQKCDRFAYVLFEDLDAVAMIVCDASSVGAIYRALSKRHAGEGEELWLSKANYDHICRDRQKFEALGLHVVDLH